MTSNNTMELGDIIKIISPGNDALHNKIFFIYYLDEETMTIISKDDYSEHNLNIENEELMDESIENIKILKKNDEKGFARQNNLVVGKNISIEFGGQVPFFINGKITNLEEDMIEITTYSDNRVLYIDFEYKGIPKNLPIVSIKDFIPPDVEKEPEDESVLIQGRKEDGDEDALSDDIEQLGQLIDENDMEIYDDDDLKLMVNEDFVKVMKQNKELIIEGDDVFSDDIGAIEVQEEYEVKEGQKRYDLEAQTSDILNDMLSTIPTDKQSPKVLEKINTQIKRYIELRDEFSVKNSENNIIKSKVKGRHNKPLKQKLKDMDSQLNWIIPIVSNIKKIYNIDVFDDDAPEDIIVTDLEFDLFDDYRNNHVSSEENKTNYLINKIHDYLNPIEKPEDKRNILNEVEVNNNIETIVNNNSVGSIIEDNAAISTTIYNEELHKKEYNIQKYITSGMMTELDPNTKRRKLVKTRNNETMFVKGFLTVPTKLRKIYDINGINNILHKSQAHYERANYSNWNLLGNMAMQTQNFNEDYINDNDKHDLDSEIQLNDKYFKQYLFNEKIEFSDRNTEKTYDKFLYAMIPDVGTVINKHLQKNQGVSIDKMLEPLEYFGIDYSELHKNDYNDLVEKVEKNVSSFVKTINNHSNLAKRFIRQNKNWRINKNVLSMLLHNKHRELYELYGLKDTDLFSESIFKIFNQDNGRLWNTAISYSLLDLYQDVDIDAVVERELAETKINVETEREKDTECTDFQLAKRYIELDELKADDGVDDVYFDKKYDTTPYEIKEEFTEFENLPIDEFKDIIKKHLIEKLAVDVKMAQRDAEAIVDGAKKIRDGDYAVLEKDDKTTFYIRSNNKWRIDNDMSKKDADNISFCNTKAKCLNIKENCDNVQTNRNKMKQQLLDQIMKNFENTYTQNISEYKKKTRELLGHYKKTLGLLKNMNQKRDYFYNNKQVDIAKQLTMREIKQSPYVELRDRVLGEQDFIKRQNYIQLFVQNYCVYPDSTNKDQSVYWLYCKDTMLPLLPKFLIDLAEAFEDNMYLDKLEEIQLRQGEESADGDKIVDKYSGYTIRSIDFDLNEGYDKMGFKISTNAELEEDFLTREDLDIIDEAGDLASEKEKQMAKINKYENKDAVMIANIVTTLNTQMNISVDAEDYVISNVLLGLENDLMDERLYARQVAIAKKKKRKIKPYEYIHDEYLLLLTVAYYAIKVQTKIPSVSTSRTFPGCNPKSFKGYPLEGDDDTFIRYLICVIASIRLGSSERPWSVIPKSKSKRNEIIKKYSEKVKDYIDKKVLIRSSVQELLADKREYLSSNIEVQINEQFDLKSWSTFLPPLIEIKVKELKSVDSSFFTRFNSAIREGDGKQRDMYHALLGKIIKNSFYIQELIEKVVKKETLLLSTVGNVVTQNSCCNVGEKYTIDYFMNKDGDIAKYKEIVERLTMEKYRYKNNTLPFINDKVDRKTQYTEVGGGFDEEIIYKNFIKHCHFNSGLKLNDELKLLCGKNTSKFTRFQSLKEKIDIMKKENLNYSEGNLVNLLNYMNKKTRIDIDLTLSKTQCDEGFLEIVNLLETKKINKNYSIEILEKIKQTMMGVKTDSEFKNTDRLQIELSKEIEVLKSYLVEKMKVIGEQRKLKEIFDDMLNWEQILNDITLSPLDRTNHIASDFLKNNILFFIDYLPNMIINNADFRKIKGENGDKNALLVPKHWNLSEYHRGDIESFMFKEFNFFTEFHDDQLLDECMVSLLNDCKDIKDFVKNIPYYCQYVDNEGKVEERKIPSNIIMMLYYHSLLIVFSMIINSETMIDQGLLNDLNKRELQVKLKKIVFQCANLMKNRKSMIDMNQDTIKSKVSRVKEKEKEQIKERLGNLSKEARKIEDVMKNLSLGDWAVGRTSAIYIYNEDQYDKERHEIEQNALRELQIGAVMDDVSDMHRDIYMMDHIAEQHSARLIEREENTINMAEDDDFGENFDGDEYY